jgi:hypothetical protein
MSARTGSCSSKQSSRPLDAWGASISVRTARAAFGSWQSFDTLPLPGLKNRASRASAVTG